MVMTSVASDSDMVYKIAAGMTDITRGTRKRWCQHTTSPGWELDVYASIESKKYGYYKYVTPQRLRHQALRYHQEGEHDTAK